MPTRLTTLGSQMDPASIRVIRLRRLLLWSPWLCVIALVVSLLAYSETRDTSDTDTTGDTTITVTSIGVARHTVDQWLADGGLPYGAHVIAMTAATHNTSPPTGDGTQITLTTAEFLVLTGNASVAVSTTVAHNTTTGAYTVRGSPTVAMVPHQVSFTPDTSPPWTGQWPTATINEAAATAVDTWATAYYSGSASKLQGAAGDTDPSHNYLPMSGATIQPPRVLAAIVTATDKQSRPTTIIATIAVAVSWDEGNTWADTGFDVRIDKATTAAPTVTSWGAVGTGTALEAYGNALNVAVEVGQPQPMGTPPPIATPTSTPTGSPSPSQEPT